jgi:hypothetical protein
MTPRAKRAVRGAMALAIGGAALGTALASRAQRLDAKRPKTLLVDAPRGASPTARVDGRRSGLSRTPLPTGTLRIAWQRALGVVIEGAPLVTEGGDVIVTTLRGEAITLDHEDGSDRPRAPAAGTPVGSPAILADGTVVFLTAAGDAVGVRNGALRFKTRIGDAHTWNAEAGALALDDGGAAIAAGNDLATLDADGEVRARASLSAPIGAPLVAVPSLAKLAAVTTSGAVVLWAPGREPMRAGSFGAPIDGAAALIGEHTLLAVVSLGQIVELDLTRGVAVTRMSSTALLLGPPALRGDVAYLLASGPASVAGRFFVLGIDASGQEISRTGVVTAPPSTADAGAPQAPPHTGVIVDAAGTIAFAAPGGEVGVLTKDGPLELLGETFCTHAAGLAAAGPSSPPWTAAYAGLAPAGPRAFVVACETGVVAKITSLDSPL